MRNIFFKILIVQCFCSVLLAQSPADKAYKILDETIGGLNPATNHLIIVREYNYFLLTYPNTSFEDEILYKIAEVYGIMKIPEGQLITLIKLKVLHNDSPFLQRSSHIIDSLVTYQTELLVTQDNENAFLQLNNLPKAATYRSAYIEFLSFIHYADIPLLYKFLLEDINNYRLIFKDEQKDLDALTSWKAITHKKRGNYDQALYYFKTIPTLFPESRFIPGSLLNIADIYNRYKNKKELASEYLFNLINQYPNLPESADAQFQLAQLFETHYKDLNEAFANYKILIHSFPDSKNYLPALLKISEIAEHLNNFEDVIEYNRLIIENSLNEKEVVGAFTKIASTQLEFLNQPLLAAQTYRSLVNVYPNNPRAAEYLLKSAKIYGKYPDQKEKSKKLLKIIIEQYRDTEIAEEAKAYLKRN